MRSTSVRFETGMDEPPSFREDNGRRARRVARCWGARSRLTAGCAALGLIATVEDGGDRNAAEPSLHQADPGIRRLREEAARRIVHGLSRSRASGGDPWTIGWGSTGPDIKKGVVWTQQQCDDRFASHLDEFAQKVSKLLGSTPTTQHQFDAMVSFAYNVGVGNLSASTLLKKHKAGDYKGAAAEFARWNKAAGKVLPG